MGIGMLRRHRKYPGDAPVVIEAVHPESAYVDEVPADEAIGEHADLDDEVAAKPKRGRRAKK